MVIEASRVAVGTAHIATMNIVTSLIAFIFAVSIARFLAPGDVGLISITLSTIAIFNTLTPLALNSAVIKHASFFPASTSEVYGDYADCQSSRGSNLRMPILS